MPRGPTALCWFAAAVFALATFVSPAFPADQLNAYSLWSENWARPMLQEFEQAIGS